MQKYRFPTTGFIGLVEMGIGFVADCYSNDDGDSGKRLSLQLYENGGDGGNVNGSDIHDDDGYGNGGGQRRWIRRWQRW